MGLFKFFKKKINSKEVEIRVVNKTINMELFSYICYNLRWRKVI